MICIIRIQALAEPEKLWNEVRANYTKLQAVLDNRGKILYLSKRCKYNEVSLFVHVADTDVLGDFIAKHLAKLQEVTGIWLINMLKPIFFPLAEDISNMKRYIVTVKAYSPRLSEIYEQISQMSFPDGIRITYLAYTCHLFGDCLQFSLFSESETGLNKLINETISHIPGVLRTTVCEIEKNHSFISFEDWQDYSSQNPLLVEWDGKNMVEQFRKHSF